jgi:hypothetical protein
MERLAMLAFVGIIADCCGSLGLTLADQGISIELCLRWTNLGISSFLVTFEQHLADQLENEVAITDATAREEVQRTAFNDGNLIQQIGALLLELGRTTLSLHMGQSPVSRLSLWVNHVETGIWNCLCQWHCQIKKSESCLHAGIAVCRVRLLSMRGLPFSYHLQDQTPLWYRLAGFNVLCLFMSTPMNVLLSPVL